MATLGWGLISVLGAAVALGFEPFMTRPRAGDAASVRNAVEAAGMRYISHRHVRGHRRLLRQPSGRLARYVVAEVAMSDESAAQVELLLDPLRERDFRISRINKAQA